jgi:hypothetical protein
LWATDIAFCARVFLWRILAQGLYTNKRTCKMGYETGLCPFCKQIPETTAHLFFECSHVQELWQQVMQFSKTPRHHITMLLNGKYHRLLTYCCGKTGNHTARLLTVYETSFALWKRRNKLEYDGVRDDISPRMIFSSALLHARALVLHSAKGRKQGRLIEAVTILTSLLP